MLAEITGHEVAPSVELTTEGFAEVLTMEEIEKKVIEQRLRLNKGNAMDAAKSLAMSRSAFYRRLDKFGL
jgi:transcriptional regulator of acetoin/glycerol metabolism